MEEKEEPQIENKKRKISYKFELGPNLTWILTLIIVGGIVLLSSQ